MLLKEGSPILDIFWPANNQEDTILHVRGELYTTFNLTLLVNMRPTSDANPSCVEVLVTSKPNQATPAHYQQRHRDFSPLTHPLVFTSLISRCFGEDTCITIPDIDAVVMVLQPSEPRITITGVERLSRPASDLGVSGGIALFQDLHIISTVTRADANAHHTGINS